MSFLSVRGPVALDNILGALFLGNIAAAIFYGITCVQTYIYYKKDYRDPPYFKFLIFFLWILDNAHLALITYASYDFMVSNFGNIAMMATPTPTMLAQVYVTAISDFIIRSIFGRQVWLVYKRNVLLALCIGTLSILILANSFAYATKSYILVTYEKISHELYLIYTELGGAVVANTLITTSLCIALSRKRTGFKRTGSVIKAIMIYAINTTLLMTICALLGLIAFLVWPNTFIGAGIYYGCGKLFFISLLAALNNRDVLQESLNDVIVLYPISSQMNNKSRGRNPDHPPVAQPEFAPLKPGL